MRFTYVLMTLVLAGTSFADVLVLKNGQVVNGNYLGGTARQVRMEVNNQIQTFDVGEITTLSFSGNSAVDRSSRTRLPFSNRSHSRISSRRPTRIRIRRPYRGSRSRPARRLRCA